VSLSARISWMVSGPARLEELERSVVALQQQLAVLGDRQEAALADVRSSVSIVLDDVTGRLAALDATDVDD
jgi:hypothetical protein